MATNIGTDKSFERRQKWKAAVKCLQMSLSNPNSAVLNMKHFLGFHAIFLYITSQKTLKRITMS